MVMAVRAKNQTELRVAEAKLPITINGRKTSVWIDSGSPISIFTNHELRRTLGAAGIRLLEVDPQDQEFRDYGNNPINLLGTMKVELASNGWSTSAVIKVIGGARPSIIGRDLMFHLGLKPVQRKPGQEVISIQETVEDEGESQLEKWQDCFSKLFSNLINRMGKIRPYKVQAEFFNKLISIQQKGRRVPIKLQD